LEELATNLRWSWHNPTMQLFSSISPEIWEETGHDPVTLLGAIEPARLAELAADEGFVARANELRDDLHSYLTEPRWYQSLTDAPKAIAYFSPEFGIAAALPQYSGGLGILAGDHLKSASDLGVPIIAAGLFYRAGYFRQAISRDGWQKETYPVLDPDGLPLRVLRNPDGTAAQVTLALPNGEALFARIWKVAVGRVTLLLLDTDVPENEESLRNVTDRLYGGGGEHRLLQELLLGIGGVRAIKIYTELTGGAAPEVFHTNEGHAGFLGLERISDLIGGGLSFDEALQVVRAGTVFTTHTPVPAGIDRFDAKLVQTYFSTDLLPGVAVDSVLALGAESYDGGTPDTFNMAVMGLRLGQRANGVSLLHGDVSRGMFGAMWPGFDQDDVPITSVTNGVHAPTWTDPLLLELASSKLGTSDTTAANWLSDAVSDGDIWAVRHEMKKQLVTDARARLIASYEEENPGGGVPAWFSSILDPEVLTIGFARRVPTYKRLTLMLRDPERLRALLTHPTRPVQIVIAGKSHPADEEGKRLIQQLIEFAAAADVRHRMVFLPNYDIAMAALNGSLNLSILDGWWAEFFDGENGWAIPTADTNDPSERDDLEANSMYDLIEHQIAPRFYDRGADGVPSRWVESIRHTLATLSPALSADRMVKEYVNRLYIPAAQSERAISASGYAPARELSAWKAVLHEAWPRVQVLHVESGGVDVVPQIGDSLHVRARVALDGLRPEDVKVEIVYGRARDGDRLADIARQRLVLDSVEPGQPATFTGTVALERPGSFGYNVRVVPSNPLLANPAELGLIAVAH
jgi:starch phosphorylase